MSVPQIVMQSAVSSFVPGLSNLVIPTLTAICHCADCQRSSGSAFSVVVGVPHDSLRFTGDEPKVYDTMGEDGGELAHRSFCGTCGSPIMSTLDDMPGLALRDDDARFTRGLPAV
jgi:hypothetical protein